eukprot:scaffold246271_cov17-Tisochrysis_lutea.AAC.1
MHSEWGQKAWHSLLVQGRAGPLLLNLVLCRAVFCLWCMACLVQAQESSWRTAGEQLAWLALGNCRAECMQRTIAPQNGACMCFGALFHLCHAQSLQSMKELGRFLSLASNTSVMCQPMCMARRSLGTRTPSQQNCLIWCIWQVGMEFWL